VKYGRVFEVLFQQITVATNTSIRRKLDRPKSQEYKENWKQCLQVIDEAWQLILLKCKCWVLTDFKII
jgi:hypothetical protein